MNNPSILFGSKITHVPFLKNLGSLFVNRNQKVEEHHMEKQHKEMDS